MAIDSNFLNCTFRRRLDWRTEGSRIVALRPVLGHSMLSRWLTSRLRLRHEKIRLDEIGAAIWLHCDGTTLASEIAQLLRSEFGARVEPAEEKLYDFVMKMCRAGMISISR